MRGVVAVVVLFSFMGAVQCNRWTWTESFRFQRIDLADNLTLTKAPIEHCAGVTGRLVEKNAFCYNKASKECLSGNLEYLRDSTVTPIDDWRCYINSRNCIHSISLAYFQEGDIKPDNQCTQDLERTCENGVITTTIKEQAKVPPPIGCPAPWTQDITLGCIWISPDPAEYCDARVTCMQMEGDLLSFDDCTKFTLTDVATKFPFDSYIYMAAMRDAFGQKWYFHRNSKDHLEIDSSLWSNGHPIGNYKGLCVGLKHSSQNGLNSYHCDKDKTYYICSVCN